MYDCGVPEFEPLAIGIKTVVFCPLLPIFCVTDPSVFLLFHRLALKVKVPLGGIKNRGESVGWSVLLRSHLAKAQET